MIAILPASIETYLKDAKFSTTEILVIRKLLEEDALTLRELATKTGKSTGVLDQAIKKLLGKGIVNKQAINGGFKYTMASLKPILDWMQKDMQQKYEMLERRHQNFESFIESLAVDKGRPEMQYFDGEEGIKRAYIKLLDPKQELLCYRPLDCNWEDHALKDFYVQFFRERHRRQIFSRVISHDTSFGRRFQSRDPFEYRKTILVPEADFPIPFEKMISGDVVACFNHKQKQACFIKYPEFAHAERMLFENHWKEAERKQRLPEMDAVVGAETSDEPVLVHSPEIELKTRVMSQLREFFLSKGSLVSFALFMLIAGAITFGLYKQNEYLNLQRIREKVESIAATAALQLDVKDLNALQVEEDWKKPEWGKVVNELKNIREKNQDILFAYIFRQSEKDFSKFEFVADSHSLNPYANIDSDSSNDIKIGSGPFDSDGAEKLQWPGQEYPDVPVEAAKALKSGSSLSNQDFYTDQWGTMISGYAPIKNEAGKTVAVLAVDMEVGKLAELTSQTFSPIWYLLAFFLLFVFIRFAALNKSLFRELWRLVSVRNFCLGLVICFFTAFMLTFAMYQQTLGVIRSNLSEKLMSIATTAASQFDSKDLDELHFARDMKKEAYQRVFRKLNEIRARNADIRYAYIMRKIDHETTEFVADADSDYSLPFLKDDNEDGILDEADEAVAPGIRYFSLSPDFYRGFDQPLADSSFVSDQWGTFLSGYAPLPSSEGIYMLEVDMTLSDLYKETEGKFKFWLWFFAIFFGISFTVLGFQCVRSRYAIKQL